MSDWTITQYTPDDRDEWNEFVAKARNSTFLFDRDYMDYHADRFADCSLMARRRGKLLAVLPADITATDATLHSHRGLTYGGWVMAPKHFDATDMLELTDVWLDWCRNSGIKSIDYKPLPSIYAAAPSDDDIYALWRAGAGVGEVNLSAAIRLDANPGFDSIQRSKLRRALAAGAEVDELTTDAEIAEFHALLSGCLAERHDAAPVHTCTELQLLHGRFPRNIRFFGVRSGGALQAAICVYDSARVRHCQYTATTAEARKANLLTPLTAYLIDTAPAGTAYFDFGTSNEERGRVLNTGLYAFKASFGASGIAHLRLHLNIQ